MTKRNKTNKPAPTAPQPTPEDHSHTPDAMLNKLMRDIDDTMHQERLMEYWHQYKWWFMGTLLAIIVISTGKVMWHNHVEAHLQGQADSYYSHAAAAELDSAGFRFLTAMQGDPDLDKLLEQKWPNKIKELIQYYKVQGELDSATLEKLDNGNVWLQPLALEQLGLQTMATGNFAEAAGYFERALSDFGQLPPSLRQRLEVYQAEADRQAGEKAHA